MSLSSMPPLLLENTLDTETRKEIKAVSWRRRMGAFTIDLVVVGLFSLLAGTVLGSGHISLSSVSHSWYLAIVLVNAVWADYFIVSLASKGSTFGGRMFKVWVTNANGTPISLARSARRWAVPWLAVGVPIIIMVHTNKALAVGGGVLGAAYVLVNYVLVPHYDSEGRTWADVLANTRASSVDPRRAMAPKSRRVHRLVWASVIAIMTVIGVGVGVAKSVAQMSVAHGPAGSSVMGSARLIANEAQQLARAAGSNVVTQADIGNAMQVELPKTIGLRTTELAIGHYVLEPGGSIVSLLLGDSNYNQHCVLVRFPRGAGSSPVLGGKCTG